MDSQTQLREQRRQRILENSRSRMDRILGMTGETERSEPIIDGLGHSKTVDNSNCALGPTRRRDLHGETVSSNGDEADLDSRLYNGNLSTNDSQSNSSNKITNGKTTKKAIPNRLVNFKTYWLRRRQIIAISLGAVLRIALWFGLLPIDGSLWPYFITFEAVMEAFLLFADVDMKDHASQSQPDQYASIFTSGLNRLKTLSLRVLDDFMVTFGGFVLIHLFILCLTGSSDLDIS